jgi:2-polyprenyl-3-methyl-5-hydroxy-6-metoxy-1,4-benzoquinol methylase
MRIPPELCCLAHAQPLTANENSGFVEKSTALTCPSGCKVPVMDGVPRFVLSDNYAASFGLQWKTFSKTQLDSYTRTSISRDRLTKCLGTTIDILAGKKVLEVGCGAGRFTELMLEAGAHVFACDLSRAAEANFENCRRFGENYFVCQADALKLPVVPHSFDFVICMGVIQHTPSPEATIAALARHLQPGGMLVMDHYSYAFPSNFLQRYLRRVLVRLPPNVAKQLVLAMAHALLPVHVVTWGKKRGLGRARTYLLQLSPLIDYYDVYPQLGNKLLREWSVLDTHDSLTDHYKHLRTTEEIASCLRSCGLVDLEVYYGGNGIEARAKIPDSIGRSMKGAKS